MVLDMQKTNQIMVRTQQYLLSINLYSELFDTLVKTFEL